MANLTNSGKLIVKIEAIDASISDIEDKLGNVPAGTDIMEEIGAVDDKVDGVIDSIGTVPAGSTVMDEIDSVASDLSDFESEVADTYATKDSVASAFLYKGTKANYSDLPSTGNKTGDVWNITNADPTHDVKAGDNVVWNGSAWDVLSGVMDLSNYFNKSTDDADDIQEGASHLFMTTAERTKLGNQSGTNTGDETQATIKTKLGAASASADGYLTKEDFAEFDGKQDAIEDLATIRANASGAIQATAATFVSNTVAEGADGSLTVTAADNVTVAGAETNNKAAIAAVATAHNNLVDRVEAVEAATGSLPFEVKYVNVTFNAGKTAEVSDSFITASTCVDTWVVTNGVAASYAYEYEVEAGKITFTASNDESITMRVRLSKEISA